MSRLWIILVLGIVLTAAVAVGASAADGKFVFRDGQWIFVPADQTDKPPAEPVPAKEPLKPVVPETPAPTPEVKPPVEPAPTPPVEVKPPAEKPPVETKSPVEKPAVTLPPEEPTATKPAVVTPTAKTPPSQPPIEKPSAPAPKVAEKPAELPQPAVAAASLAVPEAESVGVKYRSPAPSQAADEADKIIAKTKEGNKDESLMIVAALGQFRNGQYSKVVDTTSTLLKKSPHSPYAEAAQWLKAEAIFSDADYYKAFNTYEDFIKNYAGSELLDKAMLREVESGEALLGAARRKVWGIPLLNGAEDGLIIMEKVYQHRPSGPLAADVTFRAGEFKMTHGHFEEAEESFRKFLKEFPNHARARQAELLAAQTAMAANHGPRYDDASLKRAGDTLRAYQNKHPELAAQENVPGALEKIRQEDAQKKYEMAAYYYRAQRLKAAAFYAQKVVKEYPGTPAEVEARKMLEKLPGSVKGSGDDVATQGTGVKP